VERRSPQAGGGRNVIELGYRSSHQHRPISQQKQSHVLFAFRAERIRVPGFQANTAENIQHCKRQ